MAASRRAFTSLTAVACSVAFAIAVAACGASGGSGDPSAPASAPGSAAPGTVAVSAFEYGFTPSTISVPAGEITFSVTNTGTIEHEFEVFKGDTAVDEVEGLVPGLTRELTANLEPGDYTFVCKLSGHEEAGMKGTLTVTE